MRDVISSTPSRSRVLRAAADVRKMTPDRGCTNAPARLGPVLAVRRAKDRRDPSLAAVLFFAARLLRPLFRKYEIAHRRELIAVERPLGEGAVEIDPMQEKMR